MSFVFAPSLCRLAELSGESHAGRFVLGAILGVMLWRTLDLLIVLFSMAVFGGITMKRWTAVASAGDMHRIFVLALLNYAEIVFTFATYYFVLGSFVADQIAVPGDPPFSPPTQAQAYFLSITTVSTIGYGNVAPLGGLALATATLQTTLVLLIVTGLFGAAVSRISSAGIGSGTVSERDSAAEDEVPSRERQRRWIVFGVVLVLIVIAGGIGGWKALPIAVRSHPAPHEIAQPTGG
jgi:hypothetical protein